MLTFNTWRPPMMLHLGIGDLATVGGETVPSNITLELSWNCHKAHSSSMSSTVQLDWSPNRSVCKVVEAHPLSLYLIITGSNQTRGERFLASSSMSCKFKCNHIPTIQSNWFRNYLQISWDIENELVHKVAQQMHAARLATQDCSAVI